MKPPERPRELDLLEPWLGTWQDSGEFKACGGRVIKSTGTHEISWDLDKRILIERMNADMGEMGKMAGLAIYSYDPREKEFDYRFYGNNGETSRGELDYNEKTKVWTMEVKGRNPMVGAFAAKGTFSMLDRDTIEWTWKEWDALKLQKFMEGKGTVKRK